VSISKLKNYAYQMIQLDGKGSTDVEGWKMGHNLLL